MDVDESVSVWLVGVKDGKETAVQKVWERYFEKLVHLAHRNLQALPRRAVDEEDVALSAFESFLTRAQAGQFPHLEDRDDLWKLLMTITIRKAAAVRRKERIRQPTDESQGLLDRLPSKEPSPEIAALVSEQFTHLLTVLNDETLRSIALQKLDGRTNREIATSLDRTLSFVERKLRLIRSIWSQKR